MIDDFLPIEEYGIIGNCRTAALVGSNGSLDWLCVPRFDSPFVFGALLDLEHGGRFRIGPAGTEWTCERRYVGPTPILETTFRGPAGALRLTDFMPVTDEGEKRRRPWPHHQVVRRVECLAGRVELEVEFDPRPDYARSDPPVEDRGRLGYWCQSGAEALVLVTDMPLQVIRGGRAAWGTTVLDAGETRDFSLTYSNGEPAVLLPLGGALDDLQALTDGWWREWTSSCTYQGAWGDAVLRSAITLKLMTYAPSGAVVAAPTTSLPESVGGVRNWDYRYCWLRDASWTLRALFGLGFRSEAAAFFDWLIYVTRRTRPGVQALYDLHGETRLREGSLEHLEGYRGSRPVRVGNGAYGQLQLDVYGEVVAAAYEYVTRGGTLDSAESAFLAGLGRTVMERWHEPDEGMWEVRHGRRHNTYSKVMCAVALERLLELQERGEVDVPTERFRETAHAIRERIEARGYDDERGVYVATFDGEGVDAALLRLPLSGFLEPDHPRVGRTFEFVLEHLTRNGLLARYERDFDRLPGVEGAFGLVNFWAVEVQALGGDVEGARARFQDMLHRANDLGLYSEEIDAASGAFLGNFPQAFTHLGLINAALTLEGLGRQQRTRPSQEPPTAEEAA